MSIPEMLADLPKGCDVGGKNNSKGNPEWWVGFSELIEKTVIDAGKVPIIDPKKPRSGEIVQLDPAKKERYKIRTSVQRTNSTIKDDFGGRCVRVRGHEKVSAHLFFGLLAMTALRLAHVFT
jgi:IS5 family transposase